MRDGFQKPFFCHWIPQPLLCVDDIQATSSGSGSPCKPHNLHGSQEWHCPMTWTDVHMHPRAESPDIALAYSVTFGEHLPPSCPQFPHLYDSFGYLFALHVSEHIWSRGKEKHRVHDWAGKGMAGWTKEPKGSLKSNCQMHHFYIILH